MQLRNGGKETSFRSVPPKCVILPPGCATDPILENHSEVKNWEQLEKFYALSLAWRWKLHLVLRTFLRKGILRKCRILKVRQFRNLENGMAKKQQQKITIILSDIIRLDLLICVFPAPW